MVTWADVQAVLTNPIVTFVGGGALAGFLAYARRKLRTLEYTVHHDQVGISATDAVLGSVNVLWEGQPLPNLYLTNVVLENPTWQDFTQLTVRAYTGHDTLLLNQYTEITGTTHVLVWTPDFAAAITIPAGQAPTEAQLEIFRHRRDFIVPVLNRGQKVVMRFLTTVPSGRVGGPVVWVDMLHPGVRVEYRKLEPQIHGVPVRFALPIGISGSLAILVLSGLYIDQPWAVGLTCLLVGFIAQSIGAWMYKAYRLVKRLVVG
jgi:hypothetical protein